MKMIVTPDDQPSKYPSDSKIPQEVPQATPDEAPPSYSPNNEFEPIASGSTPLPTFKTKPTNFLAISTADTTIRGEFVIDPSIRIPSSMLPPLGDGESEDDRKNLSLASKYSSVNADIWLLGPPSSLPEESATGIHKSLPRRTTVALTADHGSIHALVHTFDGAAPFSLSAHAAYGTVHLAVPRSFQGLLLLATRHGSISLSDTLVQNATQLSQLDTTRRYFVGDFQMLGEDEWEGDRVEIEAPHGSIRIKYVDEVAEVQGKKGLFSRLFGL